jgi:hypothetical protein
MNGEGETAGGIVAMRYGLNALNVILTHERHRVFPETGVVVFSPTNKGRLLLSVLLFLNDARQILMIDLEDDREYVSAPRRQNVSCEYVHLLAARRIPELHSPYHFREQIFRI